MTETYRVEKGDTLSAIAATHRTSLEEIEKANQGLNPDKIQVGQIINLPQGDAPHHGGPETQHPLQPNGSIPGSTGGSNGGGGYVNYSGPASNFPAQSEWASYAALWKHNSTLMKLHDSESEIADIKSSIATVARQSGVDVRAILCIVVQESGGNVRVGSTNNGILNPGIMQSHAGVSFDPKDPSGSILQMVKDGTEGTRTGDGLKQCLEKYGNYYECFRAYNSGSVNKNDLNDPVGATGSYVRDAANRLMGHEWPGM